TNIEGNINPKHQTYEPAPPNGLISYQPPTINDPQKPVGLNYGSPTGPNNQRPRHKEPPLDLFEIPRIPPRIPIPKAPTLPPRRPIRPPH
ncbi:leguminosin proline-rich group669 secreted peptide, partial [Trifolium medium]|nr:leguminosin proline-rich group669 secreted peptide [Trifolium medium]